MTEHFSAQFGARGASLHADWATLFNAYRSQYPDLALQIERMQQRALPDELDSSLPSFAADPKGIATRDASGKVLNALAAHMPWLLGGAADLSPSTKTHLSFDFAGDFEPPAEHEETAHSYAGRNLHFGVREHAMCAVAIDPASK